MNTGAWKTKTVHKVVNGVRYYILFTYDVEMYTQQTNK